MEQIQILVEWKYMHSHRSEAYAILYVLVFLSEYSNYFSLPLNNKCTIYCGNKEIVKKFQKLTKTKNGFKPYYKMSEHEEIIAIQQYLPKRIHVINIYIAIKMRSKERQILPSLKN